MSHKLTPKQVNAIHLLAGGQTTIEVGRKLKLRRETLSRWRQIPEFTAEFERVMGRARGDMRHRLTHLVEASISTVIHEMSSGYCNPKRLQAAISVLKLLGIDRVALPEDNEKVPK